MIGKVIDFTLNGRSCACFAPDGTVGEGLPLAVLCGWKMEERMSALAAELPPMLLFFAEAEGGRDFTPWPAPGVREGEMFTGEAAGYLSFLRENAVPYLEEHFGASRYSERRGLLGYSLGGLFALWAMAQGAEFGSFASLSGSLWYDGFSDYLERTALKGTERVYLSLGDREEFGGPLRMRRVGDATRQAAARLEKRLPRVVLEWNRGGHGKGVEGRWKKALDWMTAQICIETGSI